MESVKERKENESECAIKSTQGSEKEMNRWEIKSIELAKVVLMLLLTFVMSPP